MSGEPLNWFAVVPGYREAVEHENTLRDAAFLEVPETICGIEVLPMTPRHFILLDAIGCPCVRGGTTSAEEIARFLWIISPEFRTVKTWFDRRVRARFVRRCRKINVAEADKQIETYIEEAFQDSPGAQSGAAKVLDWSWIAALVHQSAAHYHWSESDILNLPLKRLFQYSRICKREENPRAIFFNPRDKARRAWLLQRNSGN